VFSAHPSSRFDAEAFVERSHDRRRSRLVLAMTPPHLEREHLELILERAAQPIQIRNLPSSVPDPMLHVAYLVKLGLLSLSARNACA
jgi:hypothetical protein